MIVTILRIYFLVHMTREAFLHSKGEDMSKSMGWWRKLTLCALASGVGGAFAVWISSLNASLGDVLGFLVGGFLAMPVLLLPFAGIAWLLGRRYRPAGIARHASFYVFNDDTTTGPFELQHIMTLASRREIDLPNAQVCAVETKDWLPAAEVLRRMKPLPRAAPQWQARCTRLFSCFQPSAKMNYRVFIPSLIAALILGVLLHMWLGEHYRFQAVGSGVMMKTDRWSGQAWTTYGSSGQWKPVRD